MLLSSFLISILFLLWCLSSGSCHWHIIILLYRICSKSNVRDLIEKRLYVWSLGIDWDGSPLSNVRLLVSLQQCEENRFLRETRFRLNKNRTIFTQSHPFEFKSVGNKIVCNFITFNVFKLKTWKINVFVPEANDFHVTDSASPR